MPILNAAKADLVYMFFLGNITYILLTIIEVNFLGEFIYAQIVNGNVNQTQTLDNYVKNPRRKIHRAEREREREISLNQRDYKFSTLYYKFNYLGFDPI